MQEKSTAFRFNDRGCDLFNSYSPGRKSKADSLLALDEYKQRELWIHTDEALDTARWNDMGHGWSLILAALPTNIVKSRQSKMKRNCAECYIQNWP